MALVVGRILSADQHPGARAPSYLLTVDLGGEGRRETTLPAGDYAPEQLEGRQVVCAVAREGVTVLTAHARGRGLVLVAPERDVEDGTPVA
ncbi:MAG: tRNA-binding protein [Thermoleophilia bacterium]|nr:tRNA-binding protein [Thermoleophilia bacterium]